MTTPMPLISVIMPVYNAQDYLAEAIDSVFSQSYSNWELILVDDGSKDQSGDICDKYAVKDPRIHVVHQNNQGASAARNTGLDLAQGEWVSFLDDDDIMLPHCLETFLTHADGADLIVCAYEEFPRPKIRRCVDQVCEYTNLEAIAPDFLQLRRNGFFNPQWNKLYRRNCMGIRFDSTKDGSEDVFFSLAYLPKCKLIRVIPDILFNYRLIKGRASLGQKFVMNFPQISEQTWYAFHTAFHGNRTVMDIISQDLISQLLSWTITLTRLPMLNKAQRLMLFQTYLGDSLTCKKHLKAVALPFRKTLLLQAVKLGNPKIIDWLARHLALR